MKKIWIIGSSSGIGLELVKLYLKSNFYVIASSRNVTQSNELLDLQKSYKSTLKLIDIDVSNNISVENATKEVFKTIDKIDITIFNAGIYEPMNIHNWHIENFEEMININYLGAVRLTTNLIPFYEKQGFGRVIFNSSLSSYFGLPYGGAYGASKAALVNFAQSIQAELIVKNIEVQIINHGFVKTRLTKKNDFKMPQLQTPLEAAKKIFEGINKAYKFEIRFPFKLSMFLNILSILPYKMSLYLNRKLLK